MRSAGLLLYRPGPGGSFEVLLGHPGGPVWARRDFGAWTVPKGEIGPGEEPEAAARREFREELGADPPDGPALPLGEIRQAGGKRVLAYGLRGDFDPSGLLSNTCEITWPPRSGRVISVPELDRVTWFGPVVAADKLNPAQRPFVERLAALLGF